MKFTYTQPAIPWYQRLIGRQYRDGWQLKLEYAGGVYISEPSKVGPSPELMAKTTAMLINEAKSEA